MAKQHFNPKNCAYRFWCGTSDEIPDSTYIRRGDPNECLKQGFGAGMNANLLNLKPISKIPYSSKLIPIIDEYRINSMSEFIDIFNKNDIITNRRLLLDTTLSVKEYNYIIFWLYNNGVDKYKLPSCKQLNLSNS